MTSMRGVVTVCAALAAATGALSCAGGAQSDGATDEPSPSDGPVSLRGTYGTSFENSTFRPCGADESWWAKGIDLPSGVDPFYCFTTYACSFHVSGEGIVRTEGEYGHINSFAREVEFVTVEEIVEIDPKLPDPYCP